MDYRTPLQHLLRSLLPSRDQTHLDSSRPDFANTRPDADFGDRNASAPEQRQAALGRTPATQRRQPVAWAESSIDLAQGTEIMEFPDDTAADLMDEYFAKSQKRAA